MEPKEMLILTVFISAMCTLSSRPILTCYWKRCPKFVFCWWSSDSSMNLLTALKSKYSIKHYSPSHLKLLRRSLLENGPFTKLSITSTLLLFALWTYYHFDVHFCYPNAAIHYPLYKQPPTADWYSKSSTNLLSTSRWLRYILTAPSLTKPDILQQTRKAMGNPTRLVFYYTLWHRSNALSRQRSNKQYWWEKQG